jgi:biotin carboxylase
MYRLNRRSILLLSGGGHTGHNVLAALAGRRSELRVVASSDATDEPTLFGFDAVHVTPTLAHNPFAFEERIIEILDRERSALVIPCRDEDVVWLARFGQRHPGLNAQLLCGTPEVAAMAQDKWLSHDFCRQHDLPFAPTFVCGPADQQVGDIREFVRANGLPLVFKPRRGVEGRGIRLITDIAQAIRAAAQPDNVLQKYLGSPAVIERYLEDVLRDGIPLFHSFEGVKRSLQIMIGPHGDVLSTYCTRHAMTGRNSRTVTPDLDAEPHAIAERCAQALVATGWRGPMNIQCQPDATGRLMIHEFNARFTGATAARRLLGHDEVGIALAAFLDCPADDTATHGKALVALEGLVPRVASLDHIRGLADQGIWQRDQ